MKLLLFVVLIALSSVYFRPRTADLKTFKQFYALQGTWKMITARGAICEEWKLVNDHHLQSKGYFVKPFGDTIFNETVTLEDKSDGIYYTSTVANQNNGQAISFKLTGQHNRTFVFENPEHDFPKRIGYELISADSLHAFTDGGKDVGGKRQDFYYRRVK